MNIFEVQYETVTVFRAVNPASITWHNHANLRKGKVVLEN